MLCRKLLFLVLVFATILTTALSAQDAVLSDQASVDAFDQSILSISGDLQIGAFSTPNDIQDLSPLSNIQTIGGSLSIFNTQLVDLTGLENLDSLGLDLNLFQNELLSNVNSLNGLTKIEQSIFIEINPALTSLEGFENISEVGLDVFLTELPISNLKGFENLKRCTSFLVFDTQINNVDELVRLEECEIIGFSLSLIHI